MSADPSKQPPFATFLGIKVTSVSPEKVTAELPVSDPSTLLRGTSGFRPPSNSTGVARPQERDGVGVGCWHGNRINRLQMRP